jgi:hypothetical protein
MSASPVAPSPPPRSGRNLFLWVIGLLAAAVVVLGLGGALIAFYLARQVEVIRTGPEGVEVRTPLGSIRAEQGKAETGLPEYPGARMTETPGTVEIAGPGEEGFLVTAAKYRTADAVATVDEWYRGQLASSFEREPAGTMIRKRRLFGTEVRSDDLAYIEEKDDVIRFVVIRRQGRETEIVLARLGRQDVQ